MLISEKRDVMENLLNITNCLILYPYLSPLFGKEDFSNFETLIKRNDDNITDLIHRILRILYS